MLARLLIFTLLCTAFVPSLSTSRTKEKENSSLNEVDQLLQQAEDEFNEHYEKLNEDFAETVKELEELANADGELESNKLAKLEREVEKFKKSATVKYDIKLHLLKSALKLLKVKGKLALRLGDRKFQQWKEKVQLVLQLKKDRLSAIFDAWKVDQTLEFTALNAQESREKYQEEAKQKLEESLNELKSESEKLIQNDIKTINLLNEYKKLQRDSEKAIKQKSYQLKGDVQNFIHNVKKAIESGNLTLEEVPEMYAQVNKDMKEAFDLEVTRLQASFEEWKKKVQESS